MTQLKSVSQAHNRAFLTNFELACEAGMLAILIDILWLSHDIVLNGLSVWYSFILLGFVSALVFTGIVLYRHHVSYTHRVLKKALLQ